MLTLLAATRHRITTLLHKDWTLTEPNCKCMLLAWPVNIDPQQARLHTRPIFSLASALIDPPVTSGCLTSQPLPHSHSANGPDMDTDLSSQARLAEWMQ